MPDPNSELAQVTAYEAAAFTWITKASALITQLEAASSSNPAPTDSDSADVEAGIQAILAFQASNPVPAAPAVTSAAPSTTPPASS